MSPAQCSALHSSMMWSTSNITSDVLMHPLLHLQVHFHFWRISRFQVQGAFLGVVRSFSGEKFGYTTFSITNVTFLSTLNFLCAFFPKREFIRHSVKNLFFPHFERCHSARQSSVDVPPTRRRNTDWLALKSSKRSRRRNTRNINKAAVKSYNCSLGPWSPSNIQNPRTWGWFLMPTWWNLLLLPHIEKLHPKLTKRGHNTTRTD